MPLGRAGPSSSERSRRTRTCGSFSVDSRVVPARPGRPADCSRSASGHEGARAQARQAQWSLDVTRVTRGTRSPRLARWARFHVAKISRPTRKRHTCANGSMEHSEAAWHRHCATPTTTRELPRTRERSKIRKCRRSPLPRLLTSRLTDRALLGTFAHAAASAGFRPNAWQAWPRAARHGSPTAQKSNDSSLHGDGARVQDQPPSALRQCPRDHSYPDQ